MPLLEAPVESCSSDRSISPEVADAIEPVVGEVDEHYEEPNLYPREHNLLQVEEIFEQHIPRVELPPFIHLLPITLPSQIPETTLDELLRRVTSRNDLQNVDTVRLRVISYTISLSHLSLFMPRLQQLDLSGSVLNSIRDLGCGLIHLNHLNVSNCGLTSFDGIGSGTPAVRILIADNNMIERIGPLAELTLLQRLNKQHNCIRELGLLTFLGMCPNLLEVDLRGNPVRHLRLYRETFLRCVTSLQTLDGVILNNVVLVDSIRRTSSTEDDVSSLSSESSADNAANLSNNSDKGSLDSLLSIQQSGTTPNQTISNRSRLDLQSQMSTSNTEHVLPITASSIVVGSVLNIARNNERYRRTRKAWHSNSNSSSSSSVSM